MKLLSAIIAGLCLVGIPQAALASGCYGSYYYTPTYYNYKTVTVVKEVPLYVAAYVPVVTVGYAPTAVAPYAPVAAAPAPLSTATGAAQGDPCAELRGRVAAMEKMLQRLTQQPASPPQEQAPAPTAPAPTSQMGSWVNVLVTKCAECHTNGKTKGGFALLAEDGKTPVKFTPEQVTKILKATKGNQGKPPTMPKGKPQLTDQEFGSLLDLVD